MKQPDKKNTKTGISRRTLLRAAVYSTIALPASVAYAQADNLEIIRTNVPIAGLPGSLDGFSIGVLSDFHAGVWGNKGVINDAISSMQKLKPDVITLLGDFVDGATGDRSEKIDNAMYLFQELKALQAPLGVFAVLGNHDHWTDSTRITKLLAKLGITVLIDENKTLTNGLILAGVDDYWTGGGNTRKALAGVEDKSPVILLSHNPDITGSLAATNPVNLILAGHTHGGQIRVPFTDWAPWAPCSPKYKEKIGLFQENDKQWMFISKGVWAFFLPVRLSCPPDIALLTLKRV